MLETLVKLASSTFQAPLKSPGPPELQKFCKGFVALMDLDEMDEDTTKSVSAAPSVAAGSMAVVPYVPPKKQKVANTDEMKRGKEVDKGCKDGMRNILWGFLLRLTWTKKMIMIGVLASWFFVLLTNPVLADKAGRACADLFNLMIYRVWQFVSAFYEGFLTNLFDPFSSPAQQPTGNIQTSQPSHVEHQQVPTKSGWEHFMHELGTAAFGAACTLCLCFAQIFKAQPTA